MGITWVIDEGTSERLRIQVGRCSYRPITADRSFLIGKTAMCV